MVRYFQSPWVLEGDAGRVFGDLDGCLGMLTRRRSAPAKFDACRRQRISNPASEVIAEPAELEHQTAVEIEPQRRAACFTRRVRHCCPARRA